MRSFNWTALVVSLFVVATISTTVVLLLWLTSNNLDLWDVVICAMYVVVIPSMHVAMGFFFQHRRWRRIWLLPLSFALPLAAIGLYEWTIGGFLMAAVHAVYTVLAGLFAWWLADKL